MLSDWSNGKVGSIDRRRCRRCSLHIKREKKKKKKHKQAATHTNTLTHTDTKSCTHSNSQRRTQAQQQQQQQKKNRSSSEKKWEETLRAAEPATTTTKLSKKAWKNCGTTRAPWFTLTQNMYETLQTTTICIIDEQQQRQPPLLSYSHTPTHPFLNKLAANLQVYVCVSASVSETVAHT